MSFRILGQYSYGKVVYLCDDTEDLTKLPKYCEPGCKALIANTSETYILNNAHKWVKFSSSNKNSSNNNSNDVIYDGGDLDNPIINDIIYDGGNLDNPNFSDITYDGGEIQ